MQVEAFAPKRFIVPEVFTNGDAQFGMVKIKKPSFARRFKVTRIVKHVVFGQQCLVGKTEQLPIANHRGRIKEPASSRKIRGTNSANDSSDAFSRGDDLVQRIERMRHHVAIQKPVERGVTLYRHLWNDYEIRTVFPSMFNCADNAGRVARILTVGRVDLPDGYFHCRSVC